MNQTLQYIVDQESIDFLFDNDLLPKRKYDNIVELQYDIDELRTFNEFNVSYSKTDDTPSYDSMYFAVIEHHINNVIRFYS